jgi:REP element-mobilizing transposase RayT
MGMRRTIAYMITWTTYGTWLQGDERGFVKDGMIYPGDAELARSNQRKLKTQPVKLSPRHRQMVGEAMLQKARQLNQKIHALSVSSTHVHLVAEYIATSISRVVSHYKNAAQIRLRETGLSGRIWTKGFDKRYCFDQKSLQNRIDYVNSHTRVTDI